MNELTEIFKKIKDEISPVALEYFGVRVRDVLSVTQSDDGTSLYGHLREDDCVGSIYFYSMTADGFIQIENTKPSKLASITRSKQLLNDLKKLKNLTKIDSL